MQYTCVMIQVHLQKKYNKDALQCFFTALVILTDRKDSCGVGVCFNTINFVHRQQINLVSALAYFSTIPV